MVIPLVVVNAPIKADVRLFYTSILEVLRIPVTARESITSLEEKIVTFTENYDVKIIAIDNLDNLLNGTQAKRLDVVNAIKNLQDRTTIKFVLIGRLESVCNKEISDTFGEQYKHLHIPKLLNDKNGEIVHFIDTITFLMPFEDFSLHKHASSIYYATKGVAGKIVHMVKIIALLKIEFGLKEIDYKVIDEAEKRLRYHYL